MTNTPALQCRSVRICLAVTGLAIHDDYPAVIFRCIERGASFFLINEMGALADALVEKSVLCERLSRPFADK